MWRRSLSRPGLAGLPAAIQRSRDWPPFQARVVKPRISTLTRAALEGARQDVGAHRRDGDRAAAHRARIVDQQGDDGVAEIGLLLPLVGERQDRVGDDARQPRGVEQPFFEIELPGPGLLRQQPALQPVGEPGDDALQMRELLVEQLAQARQLVGIAQLVRLDDLVGGGAEGAIDRGVVIAAARHVCRGGPAGRDRRRSRPASSRRRSASASSCGVFGGAVGGRAIGRGLRAGGRAVALVLVFAVGFLAVLLLVVFRRTRPSRRDRGRDPAACARVARA